MHIYFISISGNTRSFVNRLAAFSQKQHETASENPLISLTEISEESPLTKITEPFVVFVPTYLSGGNGVETGDQEILTETMRELLEYEENYQNCLGVVGSGNKNFNHQYCLTAKQYCEQFKLPFLADYELRGTAKDLARIYDRLKELKQPLN